MQPADSARYTAYVLVCGAIYAVYLGITDSWTHLAGISNSGNRASDMQPAESARYTAYILIYGKMEG